MWGSGYWALRYWPRRYWTRLLPLEECLPVDTAIRFRYGTGRHWGTGWKYGGGTVSEPYIPICGDPCRILRFALEAGADALVPFVGAVGLGVGDGGLGSALLYIDSGNVLRVRYGSQDEHYYLQDPSGTWWDVHVSASEARISRSIVSAQSAASNMVVYDATGNAWTFSIAASGAMTRTFGASGLDYEEESLGPLPIFTEETC